MAFNPFLLPFSQKKIYVFPLFLPSQPWSACALDLIVLPRVSLRPASSAGSSATPPPTPSPPSTHLLTARPPPPKPPSCLPARAAETGSLWLLSLQDKQWTLLGSAASLTFGAPPAQRAGGMFQTEGAGRRPEYWVQSEWEGEGRLRKPAGCGSLAPAPNCQVPQVLASSCSFSACSLPLIPKPPSQAITLLGLQTLPLPNTQ